MTPAHRPQRRPGPPPAALCPAGRARGPPVSPRRRAALGAEREARSAEPPTGAPRRSRPPDPRRGEAGSLEGAGAGAELGAHGELTGGLARPGGRPGQVSHHVPATGCPIAQDQGLGPLLPAPSAHVRALPGPAAGGGKCLRFLRPVPQSRLPSPPPSTPFSSSLNALSGPMEHSLYTSPGPAPSFPFPSISFTPHLSPPARLRLSFSLPLCSRGRGRPGSPLPLLAENLSCR